jgi:hypothetical protein
MSGYIGNIPTPQATQTRDTFTATSGQTSFATSGYTPGFLDVFLNGVHLVNGTDYTASNGSDVVLTTGATTGDNLEVVSYSTYEVNAQTYTGGLTAKNDGAAAITANRLTSDGTILDLKKDGTSVGAIGTNSSRITIGTNASGVRFRDSSGAERMEPWDMTLNSPRDAATSLGWSTVRWKDLYLSGGVYLGGTGSANLLDDYEEGNWTPVLTDGSTAISGGTIVGTYTKIGRLVHARFSFINAATNLGLSGMWLISNLPFSIQGQTGEYIGGFVTFNRNISMSGDWMGLWSFPGASYFQLRAHYMNGTESVAKSGSVPSQMLFSGEVIYPTA